MRIPNNEGRSRAVGSSEIGRGRAVLRATVALLCLTLAVPLAVAVDSSPVSAAGTYSSIPMRSWRLNGVGRAILKVGNTIYVGGSFTEAISPDGAQRVSRRNLAAFDATTGALIPGFRADTDNAVYNIQIDGNTLYVGGVFTAVGGVSRARLAALDATTGAVRTGFSADTNGNVYNLSLAAGKLYVAGAFTTIGGQPRTRAAAVSPATGAVDPTFRPVVDGLVEAIAAAPGGSKVYIGGPYDNVNGQPDADISTVDGVTGATVGPDLQNVVGYVDDLHVTPDGRSLIAAHSGDPGIGNRTSLFDTATGRRVWRQLVDGDTQGTTLVGDQVFSGFHDGSKGDGASRVALYDRSTGVEDTTFRPSFDRFMGAYAVDGDTSALVIAGSFSTISGVRAEGFAIFPASGPTSFAASVWGYDAWRYLDTGTAPAGGWQANGFDATTWKSGIGEFGYGDADERTKIGFGGSSSNKHITSWFRREFDATTTPTSAGIYMRVDDGAVVYVNGVEVARDNMPSGAVAPSTLALVRDGNAEDEVRYFPIDPRLITPGRNTIAVEVHQASPSSDDLTFFATVVAYGESSATTTTSTTTTVPATTTTTTTTTTTPLATTTTAPTTTTTTAPTTTTPSTTTTTLPTTTTVPTPGTLVARDAFDRAVTAGWGTADLGGNWTVSTGSTFNVAGGAGNLSNTAGGTRQAHLRSTAATTTDVLVTLSNDRVATGSGLYVSVIPRSIAGAGDYRAVLRTRSDGLYTLRIDRGSTIISPEVIVADLVSAPDRRVDVRVQAIGTNPTTIQARAWATGTPEPTTWTRTVTDSTPALQQAGNVGFSVYLSSSATNGPITTSIHDLTVTTP